MGLNSLFNSCFHFRFTLHLRNVQLCELWPCPCTWNNHASLLSSSSSELIKFRECVCVCVWVLNVQYVLFFWFGNAPPFGSMKRRQRSVNLQIMCVHVYVCVCECSPIWTIWPPDVSIHLALTVPRVVLIFTVFLCLACIFPCHFIRTSDDNGSSSSSGSSRRNRFKVKKLPHNLQFNSYQAPCKYISDIH